MVGNKWYLRKSLVGVSIIVGAGFLLMAALWAPAQATAPDDVKKAGVLRHLGIPYANFVTGSGDGLDVELMMAFAKHLGVRYEYVKTDWGEVFGDLTGKTVKVKGNDVEITGDASIRGDVIANGVTVLPWRERIVAFSTPTFPNQVWLVARADSRVKPIKPSGNLSRDVEAVKKIIQGHSLLGKAGTCIDPTLYGIEKMEGTRILDFSGSLNDVAPALLNKDAELTLLDVPDALVALQKWPGKIKIVGPVSEVQDMSVAFSKDSPQLREAFNGFLEASKKDGSYPTLVKKYYPFVFDYFPQFFKKK
jgi:ABC-type amino acid transport substrate-binding protein